MKNIAHGTHLCVISTLVSKFQSKGVQYYAYRCHPNISLIHFFSNVIIRSSTISFHHHHLHLNNYYIPLPFSSLLQLLYQSHWSLPWSISCSHATCHPIQYKYLHCCCCNSCQAQPQSHQTEPNQEQPTPVIQTSFQTDPISFWDHDPTWTDVGHFVVHVCRSGHQP